MKKIRITIFLVLVVLLTSLILYLPFAFTQVAITPQQDIQFKEVDILRIEEFMKSQIDIGPRIPGTDNSKLFGDYIINLLNYSTVWKVVKQEFNYMQTNLTNYLILNRALENAFPKYLIGAHYDTRAKATLDIESNQELQPPGANDGASGVAGVLELALLFNNTDAKDLGFLLFDAEDQGRDSGGYGIEGWDWIVGSSHLVDNLTTEEKESIEFFILLDIIGHKNLELRYEVGSNKLLRGEIWGVAELLGYSEYFIKELGLSVIDDHKPFLSQNIPAVDIIGTNGFYSRHKISDDLEHISYSSIAIVTEVVQETIKRKLNNNTISSTSSINPTSSASPTSTINNLSLNLHNLVLSTSILIFIAIVNLKSKKKKR